MSSRFRASTFQAGFRSILLLTVTVLFSTDTSIEDVNFLGKGLMAKRDTFATFPLTTEYTATDILGAGMAPYTVTPGHFIRVKGAGVLILSRVKQHRTYP